MCSGLFAADDQPASISGRVVDLVTGQPLRAVNVMVLGTGLGDATDGQGNFTIEGLRKANITLFVSAIGHEDQRRSVSLPLDAPLIIRLRETFFQMDEVVVTGTRTEKILIDVPVPTEIISRQDILDSGARDIGELLAQRSGVTVGSGVEGGTTVNLLGIDARYVLILVDGQPVSGKFNNRINLDQLSTANVDKVEIIKGPSSAVYGSEAMGGVINIITDRRLSRSPLSVRTRFTGSASEAKSLADTDNPLNLYEGTRDARLNLDVSRGDLRVQFDLDALWANVGKAMQYRDIDEFDKLSLRGQITWQGIPKHSFDLRLNRFVTNERSLLEISSLVTATTDIQRTVLTAIHGWSVVDGWKINTIGRWESYERDYQIVQSNASNITSEGERELELNLIRTGNLVTFNTGVELTSAEYHNDRVSGGSRSLTAAGYHLQADWQANDKLTLVAGGRVDNNNEINPIFSPRLAAMYRLDERWKLRASGGRGFRMPTFMDRYISWYHSAVGYTVIGNPDLEPETSQGYNLGVEYYHPGEYLVTLTFYQNRFNQMIEDYLVDIGTRIGDYEVTSPGTFSYRNIEQARLRGVELQGRWHVSTDWLMSWGYNYVDNRDLSTGELLPNTQPHSATFRLSHKHGGGIFSYAFKAKVVAPYHPTSYDPDLARFVRREKALAPRPMIDYDAKLRLAGYLTLGLGMHNMLDYKNYEYGPFLGRTYYLELETELRKGS
ncbi:MAG: TonB-dependent receptor [Candidatus Marinimicrobia bacterium]|nr:TonB-dependent receptor [Candidatus Neomarinimicrobiota bacterium]